MTAPVDEPGGGEARAIVVAPFTAGASRGAALAGALINLAAGGTAGALLFYVGRGAADSSQWPSAGAR
jgi:hypothetical protein